MRTKPRLSGRNWHTEAMKPGKATCAVAVAPVIDDVVHRDRFGAAVLHADLQMILQIGADAGQVGDHFNAEVAQNLART